MGCELYINKTVITKIMYVQKQNKAEQKKECHKVESQKPYNSLSPPPNVIFASI